MGWWRIFRKGRRAADIESLRTKVERFRSLLDKNNAVLDLMAEAGEALGGDLLFDSSYARQFAARIEEAVLGVVLDLDSITGEQFPSLMESFERIRSRIAEVLESRLSVPHAPPVLPLRETARDLSDAVGEKMARLGEIKTRLDCEVPEGFVITSSACQRVFEAAGVAERLGEMLCEDGTPAIDVREIEARLEDLILHARVPRDVARPIRRAASALARSARGTVSLAIRSSAIGEDGDLSFAGLHKTILGVPPEKVIESYRRVLASLFSAPAIAYRVRHKEPIEPALMAVGCMSMVPARAAGVVYTLDPTRPEEDVIVVTASPGLGRIVVEGGGNVDRFLVSRMAPHAVVSRNTATKTERDEIDPAGGVHRVPIPADRRNLPAVPDEFLSRLAETALRIERYMRSAQDIEWAQSESGRPVILQARPLRLEPGAPELGRKAREAFARYRILLSGRGTIACRGIGSGRVVVLPEEEGPLDLPPEYVLVAHLASPHLAEFVPGASAVLTDIGASTGHLATIARELRVPTVVDLETATSVLSDGMEVTVDAEENVVYEGRIEELLRDQAVRRSFFEDTREFRVLRRMLRHISPLNLVDPRSDRFRGSRCETYHDIIRFAHEMAVDHFLKGTGVDPGRKSPFCCRLETSIPLDLTLIDIGGCLPAGGERRAYPPDQIRCAPLAALLRGLLAPGVWSTEPAGMDVEALLSSATGPSFLTDPRRARRNLAIISGHYLNLNLNLGYHLNQVDCYVSEVRNDNYIYFRFAGGLTDTVRRARRTKMISLALREQDFLVEVRGDFLVGRLKKFERETMLNRLELLGLLVGFTRQMDVRMRDDSTIARAVDEFRELLYNRGLSGGVRGRTDRSAPDR